MRWAPAALALLVGCSSSGPSFPTSERFPETPRRPPSFAAEAPPPTLEALRDAPGATSGSSGQPRPLVSPLDPEEARAQVSRFFMAVLAESTRELFPLLSSQAWVLSEGTRQSAQAAWRARFAQLDYTALAGRIVAPPQSLHTYTFATAARAKRDGVPVPASATEVVVVARPNLSVAGRTRLFGDIVAFRLRPKAEQPGYEIAEIDEDFRLP